MNQNARTPQIAQLARSLFKKFASKKSTATQPAAPDTAPPAKILPTPVRRLAYGAASKSLKLASESLRLSIIGLELLSDITPALRMARRNRLPHSMAAGVLGAEVATWAAIWPSLLPRPWWVTALNVSIGQAVGHFFAASAAFGLKNALRAAGKRPQDHLTPRLKRNAHWVMGTITLAAMANSVRNQGIQANLVSKSYDRGPLQAAIGVSAGTLGYGVLLLIGEAVQFTVSRLSRQIGRAVPMLVAWPLAVAALIYVAFALSDRVVLRRFIRSASVRAQRLNQSVFPNSMMPWEPERSGSPWSYEPWTAVGAQGRRFLSSGPRAHDIAEIMEFARAREPIRIYAGLTSGRSLRGQARRLMSEMDRTGAFHRDTIIIQMPAGSGWINEWSAAAPEFLTKGNCATVTMQYSILPSAISYIVDKQAPIEAAQLMTSAIRHRLDSMPEDNRPKLYLAGESLGAFAHLDNYDSLEELLAMCDGAVFTGPPSMTKFMSKLSPDPGTLERVPVIDGGRHVRFAAAPAHTRHDPFGRSYANSWQRPRVLIAQHASDPIVWWSSSLIYKRPSWMHESTPSTLYADTFHALGWAPIISFWQIGLDQINSLNVPGGHGHNYYEETFWYWDSVLGSQSRVPLTPRLAQRAEKWVRDHPS
ncbi:alpha/beta-hydrolase family protein [Corynebacterium sp.]|uniref:alpha/beta-hydrolase family protein n=1 Tax=Corynebacterium sp. TaxID=1720 RepID=UPI00264915FA|nr:alpha/beta-hydrolase family protein [Corynebacterium sp.]MDN6136025.1 alpha/beta-hydrolase family protein [Corynebacterium sp.]